jgi:hypothetical protein
MEVKSARRVDKAQGVRRHRFQTYALKSQGTAANAKGVREFQPRATPWGKEVPINRPNSERVRQRSMVL